MFGVGLSIVDVCTVSLAVMVDYIDTFDPLPGSSLRFSPHGGAKSTSGVINEEEWKVKLTEVLVSDVFAFFTACRCRPVVKITPLSWSSFRQGIHPGK